MPAHRVPRWTASELAVLREHYPAGGLQAVTERLPGRSWHSIHVKAHRLGLKCSKEPGAPKCALRGESLEEAIRLREVDKWSFARIGARFGVAESSACNAVQIALCARKGHTPAERHANGRLTERGMARLRWCLKKGMKGVEIQLRLGLSASCIAEQRRRYNAELKAHGKAPLPPPGAGEAYSGVRLSREKKRAVEALFLDGFGTAKVAARTGVSKTSCTRIRNRLVKRLRAKGESLPGCDGAGKRRVMRDHAREIPDELKNRFRALLMQRVPVKRAAEMAGIGSCTGYRLRDEMKAQGVAVPAPRLPGRTSPLQRDLMRSQAIPNGHLWRYRQLVREQGDADLARRALAAEIAEAKRNLTFEDRLALVAAGKASVSRVQHFAPADSAFTLGGVTGEVL
jgi:transposase